MTRPSIRNVAEQAGVSTATVSHVINNTRFVSDEIRKRVFEAIEELNYIPSATAQSLASKKTRIVGLIFSDLTNPFYPSVFRGIEKELKENGFDILLVNSNEDQNAQEMSLSMLFSRGVDGIILAPTGYSSDMLKRLTDVETQIVLIDRLDPEIKLPYVGIDNEQAAYAIVNHLISDGHSRIALISGLESISAIVERERGYMKALEDKGIPINHDLIFKGDCSQEAGTIGAKALLDRDPTITGIFAVNNQTTLGVLHAFRDLKIHCPRDVALVGFDDHDWADIFIPPLTVIRQPTYEMGEEAAKLLESMMEGKIKIEEAKSIILKAELIVRGSCSQVCLDKYFGNDVYT